MLATTTTYLCRHKFTYLITYLLITILLALSKDTTPRNP